MKFYLINPKSEFEDVCALIKPSPEGKKIMQKKSQIHFILIKDIKFAAINILKQDALSVGGELVSPKEAILGGSELANALLMATTAQLQKLAKKQSVQDFGLKKLAVFLKSKFIKPKKPHIMGVLNVNTDSFNPSSRVDEKSAIWRIEEFIDNGASYIDLGGVSSRPGSVYCGSKEELSRIKPIIKEIYKLNLHEKTKFSLDSFDETCIKFALDHGFKMINDISAKTSLCSLCATYDAQYVLMHMRGDPLTMQISPKYDDVLGEVDLFFADKLKECSELKKENIYLDVGIGFGKTPAHNLLLTRHLEHFLHFGCEILYGASRKSLINEFHKSSVEQRLSGSLYLHLRAFENGASIIRTHDVKEHVQMFAMDLAMRSIDDRV